MTGGVCTLTPSKHREPEQTIKKKKIKKRPNVCICHQLIDGAGL